MFFKKSLMPNVDERDQPTCPLRSGMEVLRERVQRVKRDEPASKWAGGAGMG
jgi:hypothetical protein